MTSATQDQEGRRRGSSEAAFQNEREEETRDRAERGSAVRGSDQASVAAEEDPLRLTGNDLAGGSRHSSNRLVARE